MTPVEYLRAEAGRWRAEAAKQRLPKPTSNYCTGNNPVAAAEANVRAETLEAAADAIERGALK